MTAEVNGNWASIGTQTAAIPTLLFPLAASAQVGRGQYGLIDPATGYVSLADGATPNRIPAGVGYPAIVSPTSTVAGNATNVFWVGYGDGQPASTEAGDSFTAADVAVPFYIAGQSTPGKLSNFGGNNRSLGGLVMGLDSRGNPITVCGPEAWLLARATLIANAMDFAWLDYREALAADTLAEVAIPSQKLHGLITGVQFVGAAIAADNTDYITVTISKRDGAGGGAVVLATYDSRAANNGAVTAFVPAAFTLSVVAGALNVLETDVYTITVAKGGAGKLISGAFRVIGKVQ